ncbi:MAG: hypothetical protein IPK98_09685 [Chloracidobacterium sp.]|nr:hypothetical protein [Chloracidobacterium sp.]
MIDAWNAVGIDLAVFGNHEFDLKTQDLLDRMKESKFTWLGANVIEVKTGKNFANTPPYVVKEFAGVKIGFIGLLLPETKQTSSMDDTLNVADFCSTAKKIVKDMRKKESECRYRTNPSVDGKGQTACKMCRYRLILGGHEYAAAIVVELAADIQDDSRCS